MSQSSQDDTSSDSENMVLRPLNELPAYMRKVFDPQYALEMSQKSTVSLAKDDAIAKSPVKTNVVKQSPVPPKQEGKSNKS